MSVPPIPLVFEPILKPRPWGGRRLEQLGKRLPADAKIGESWEIADLPGNVSRIVGGPLAGISLMEVQKLWGADLLGGAAAVDGRFPLLIKFLDANENLSVQVHPRPADDPVSPTIGVKHEAWYIVHAEPGATIFAGFRAGVTFRDVERCAGRREMVELLRVWPVRAGQCFNLPSGLVHALGAGVMVAEVQTPSDITYRLYDWERRDADGNVRALHIAEALANVRFDVRDEEIVHARTHVAGPFVTVTKLVATERFLIDRVRFSAGFSQLLPHSEMAIWIMLSGDGVFTRGDQVRRFGRGDTVLIPADSQSTRAEFTADCELLEVKVPILSSLTGLGRPAADVPESPGGLIDLHHPRG